MLTALGCMFPVSTSVGRVGKKNRATQDAHKQIQMCSLQYAVLSLHLCREKSICTMYLLSHVMNACQSCHEYMQLEVPVGGITLGPY